MGSKPQLSAGTADPCRFVARLWPGMQQLARVTEASNALSKLAPPALALALGLGRAKSNQLAAVGKGKGKPAASMASSYSWG